MCSNFITEGRTSKDWVLNLIPLGGVACVAYDDHGPKEETTIPQKNANHLIIFNPTDKDPFGIIPQDVILKIFSCLSLHQLGVSNRVSKTWNPFGKHS